MSDDYGDLALIMPMAGRGSRFATEGFQTPKPLVNLNGRPFFWWAVESIRREVPLREMVFIVLEEHCDLFSIHDRIANYYPQARVIKIPDVTSGAAATAQIGLSALRSNGPVAINDCDHAFICGGLSGAVGSLRSRVSGAVVCFNSTNPAYSYVNISPSGEVIGTVEKKVISPYAIAGCYLFSCPSIFLGLYERYRISCPYNELFVSGIYDLLLEQGKSVLMLNVEQHRAFGTPEELAAISVDGFESFVVWKEAGKN